MENIAEHLFQRRSKTLRPEVLADILAQLIWSLDDSSVREIFKALEQWVASDEIERVQVALAFDETFLFGSREEMVAAFDRICLRSPECRKRCDEILCDWDRQFPAGHP